MTPLYANEYFDDLSTSWTLLRQAHDPDAAREQRETALRQLVERYQNVVRRYLAGALRHERDREQAVNECLSDFSLRMMSGAFKGATPERGCFRKYLCRCLSNLVNDYGRQDRRQFQRVDDAELAVTDPPPITDAEYVTMWREELVTRALRALEQFEKEQDETKRGLPLYTVIKLKMDHPEMTSLRLAEELAPLLGKAITDSRARQLVSDARKRLAEYLVQEVRQSLDEPTDDQVYEELAELGLLEHCRSALEKKHPGS